MCGIVGIAGDVSSANISGVFRDLMDVGQVRGRDSTGVIKVAADCESYTFAKLIGPPAFLCDTRMYEKRIEQGGGAAAIIGHMRAKTIGEASNRNAHPFDFPDAGIIGVHNGTLRNHYQLPGRVHTETDSETMYRYLSENGPEKTFERLEGAWACVWWDQNEQTLNFIRNKERPLWFTWSKDCRQLFWASELWMLSAAKRKIDFWEPTKENDERYMQIPEDTLWSWRINTKARGEEKVMTLRQVKEIKAKPQPAASSRFHGNQNRTPWGWEHDDELGGYVRSQTQAQGGSVPSPFQVALDKIRDELDDNLPQSLLAKDSESSPADNSSSKIGNVEFLKHSPGSTGSSTDKNATKNSRRNILSLPAKPSKASPSSSNVVQLPGLGTRGGTQSTKGCSPLAALPKAVSFRNVAGIDFITDNTTSKEYGVDYFMKQTGGKCSFCRTSINSVKEVSAILADDMFLCNSCVSTSEAEPDLITMNIRQ